MRQNIARAERAGASTIHLLEGEALALLTDPEIREQFRTGHRLTHAFLGGTSGNMKQILEALLSLNPQMRIVINVIALESVAAAVAALKDLPLRRKLYLYRRRRRRKREAII